MEAWSTNLLAEFDTIIGHKAAVGDDDYDEVAGDSSEDVEGDRDDDTDEYDAVELEESAAVAEMRFRIGGCKRDEFDLVFSSPTVSPSVSDHSSGSSGHGLGSGTSSASARRTPPYLMKMVCGKQRSHVATVNNKHDPVLVNVLKLSSANELVSVPPAPMADRECLRKDPVSY